MSWLSENWIQITSLVGAIGGGIFALFQWGKSIRLRRAEFINQIIEKLRFNNELVKAMYLIDYDAQWYNAEFHGGSENEYIIDNFLSHLSYICYLIKTKNISSKESSILVYELERACSSYEVRSYLFNLYHWSKKNRTICSFQYLIDYGIKKKLIESEFINLESKQYPRYLNI